MSNKKNDTYQEQQLELILENISKDINAICINTADMVNLIHVADSGKFKIEQLKFFCKTGGEVSMTRLPNDYALIVATKSDTPRALNRLATAVVMSMKNETEMTESNVVKGNCIITKSNLI